jgi:hypothetical protein
VQKSRKSNLRQCYVGEKSECQEREKRNGEKNGLQGRGQWDKQQLEEERGTNVTIQRNK